jgi:ribonucleoside-triphosphate reductase (thioredoxin)
MTSEHQLLSDIIVHSKYAKYIPELKRRETWAEIVDRNMSMHIKKFPQLKDEIEAVYKRSVLTRKVLPAMRSLQFAGLPMELNNARMFNCSFAPIDDYRTFAEGIFLLLSGCGFGYSVQKHHVEKLPEINKPVRQRRYLVGDSIHGWADAVRALIGSYFTGKAKPRFDFRDIRPKGAQLVTSGGKAPGPAPLQRCLFEIEQILEAKENGQKLTPLECHSIMCHIADSVLAGGIRRSAMIALFTFDDEEMLSCKSGNWWELNPHFARANNSAVAVTTRMRKREFFNLWDKIKASGAGEPGIYLTNDPEYGTNPCVETSLRAYTFCNLVEINGGDVESQEDLNSRAKDAAFINTLQASYTDFYYLREVWKRNTEKDALIGVGITGIGGGKLDELDKKQAAKIILQENERVAELININKAARCTVVKPAGTSSLVLGTSSGIHAWHDRYYIRRIRIGKNESLYTYLVNNHPELLEDELFRPHDTAVISIPQKAPEGAHIRTENALTLLERVKEYNVDWVREGHRKGPNYHNVSATISIDGSRTYTTTAGEIDEWEAVGEWMWQNRNTYHGLSILPYSDHTYKQAPFETVDESTYLRLLSNLHSIDMTEVVEEEDETTQADQLSCAGGNCEII